ncbi:hypothetical protein R1sor_023253 [Riccia sorocarpa]|uniref:Uncharacterized protein n=1 Tax=Riccia sorocarpa TaxID=122646 RepID=A0ABD3GM57_9MARC
MDPLTVEVREEDIPVAAVQVPPTFVVDEVPLGENPMEVAPVPASDHGVDEGEILPEVVGVLDSQEAVPVIGEAQQATTSSLVDGWQDDGKFVQLVHDLADTRNEPQPVAEASTPYAVRNVEEEVATPGTAPNLEKVEFSVSEYLPIGSPAVTHDAQESGEIRDKGDDEGHEQLRRSARVELWKRKTVFRGSLLYPEEPTLRTDERVPRKPRAKKTSPAGSTPAEDETSPATKKTAKRKLNLDPPRSRSPSPEALERNQPPRNGKKKVEEGAAANMDRKGKRKVDDQPSTVPAKKNKRGDDSDEDSNKSNHAKGEAVQYTHFAALGKSEREKRQWGYIDKFINETVQDKIQKRERELKE